MTDMHDTADLVSKALRRAWQLGQTYWQQADSEYQSHWKKADATQATFDQLVEDTRAAILADNSGAQPAPNAVAYLDLGAGGYMDIGTDLTDEELDAIPKGRHMLGIVGTYGIEGYVPAQPSPTVPDGWLRAIDEALVVTHLGVANESDTYEQAREKLNNLIGFHVDIATDPAVNGGWKLVPIVSTHEMDYAGSSHCDGFLSTAQAVWDTMLAVAPEAKP